MKKVLVILFTLIFVSGSNAELVINEVMVNEPQGFTSLEWIELYNNSAVSVQLSGYQLDINGTSYILPSQILTSKEYIVLVRKLYLGSGAASFESYWGNGSEVWGDDPFESKFSEPVEIPFSLPNSGGEIFLWHNSAVVSSFSWDDAGLDGVSYERKYADSSLFEQSVSKKYSTPGYINSITPLPFDISLDYAKPFYAGRQPKIIISVTNRSLTGEDYFTVTIRDSLSYYRYFYVGSDRNDFEGTIVDTLFVDAFPWMYRGLTMYLDINNPDDRPENDTVKFTSIGVLYPPLVINEFIANPIDDVEVIELYNRSDSSVDLSDWMIGDALKVYPISETSIMLAPKSFAVVYENSATKTVVMEQNTKFPLYIGMDQWATLNNDTDSVRLIDKYNITGDAVYYTSLYDNNFTVCRENPTPYADNWFRSFNIYGSFGRENTVFKYNQNNLIEIELASKYYVYHRDPLQIYLSLPEASKYSVKIYNKEGQCVAIVADEQSFANPVYFWKGETLTGNRLPIGMYIIVVEADGVAKAKETFVVAR